MEFVKCINVFYSDPKCPICGQQVNSLELINFYSVDKHIGSMCGECMYRALAHSLSELQKIEREN